MPPASSHDSSDGSPARKRKKRVVRTHTPRPDELSRESFEFITAVDDYKRRHLRSFLDDVEVLAVLLSLGYEHPDFGGAEHDPTDDELERFQAARARYRDEEGRLFPTWSELFDILLALGYQRDESEAAESGAAGAA